MSACSASEVAAAAAAKRKAADTPRDADDEQPKTRQRITARKQQEATDDEDDDDNMSTESPSQVRLRRPLAELAAKKATLDAQIGDATQRLEQLEKRVREAALKEGKSQLEPGVAGVISLPTHWTSGAQSSSAAGADDCSLVQLGFDASGPESCRRALNAAMLHATTEAIWRVEHPALWRAFIRRSAEVISNGGMMIEAVLFGTLHPGAHRFQGGFSVTKDAKGSFRLHAKAQTSSDRPVFLVKTEGKPFAAYAKFPYGARDVDRTGCHLLLRCKVAIEREWDEVVSGRAASDAPGPDESVRCVQWASVYPEYLIAYHTSE